MPIPIGAELRDMMSGWIKNLLAGIIFDVRYIYNILGVPFLFENSNEESL
ncbi:hypothetical protein H6501_01150 [Candidatus Woesearchaeota archaeon]|nr:hypothetical protein [Candidatus Woesearchaeota archaeon]